MREDKEGYGTGRGKEDMGEFAKYIHRGRRRKEQRKVYVRTYINPHV